MGSTTGAAFEATLAEPLNFGHILQICGKAKQDADSITISFSKFKTTNNTDSSDLQIVLDFIKKQAIINKFEINHSSNRKADICNDTIIKELFLDEFLNEFKLYIMLGESKFHLALNNEPLTNFKYTNNLEKLQIQALKITGKLEWLKQLDHHKYFPHIWPPIQIIDDYLDFSNNQPSPFKPGHIITIKVHLEGNNEGRFIIHFRHARDNKRQELHVSVRFDTKKIIRNSKCRRQADDNLAFEVEDADGFTLLYSSFGQEETDDAATIFPFDDFNKPFTLAVAFCETHFRFAKDGKFLFNFSYRTPNVLPFIMGPKIFGTNGVHVRLSSIEHMCLEDEMCEDFEKYSL